MKKLKLFAVYVEPNLNTEQSPTMYVKADNAKEVLVLYPVVNQKFAVYEMIMHPIPVNFNEEA